MLSATLTGGVLSITGTEAADRITVRPGPTAGDVVVNGPGIDRNQLFVGVDSVTLDALGGNDRISVAKNITATDNQTPTPFTIDAGDGNNHVSVRNAGDDTISAADGKNRITDTAGSNHVTTGDGNNRIRTGSGDDTVVVGAGNNTINTDGGTNTITTGDGNNRVRTAKGNDTITTGSGDDRITDTGGTNTVNAGDGRNTVRTAKGDDTITTGSGDDEIRDSGGNNTVWAGDGNNTLHTGTGDDDLTAGTGDDLARDTGGNNNFALDGGNDIIIIAGGTGQNFIDPGTGNPTIISSANNTIALPQRPDDTPNTATPFNLAHRGRATLVGTAPADGTPDFFTFTSTRNDQLSLSITSPSGGHVQLQVTDPAGNPLLTTDSTQTGPINLPVVAGQRVLFRVASLDGFNDSYIATILSNGTPPPATSFTVANNTGSTFANPTLFSFPIPSNGTLTGTFASSTDSAVFSFTPTQNATLTVATTGASVGQTRIVIQNAAGGILAQTNNVLGAATAVAPVSANQPIFITVLPTNALANYPLPFTSAVSLV